MKEFSNEPVIVESHISFSMPELTGTELCICGDCYVLYAKNERLTDSFLDTLIEHCKENQFEFSYTLYSDLEYQEPISIQFSEDSIRIEQDAVQKTYPVSGKEFCDTFFANVQKYSIYWAAPANYRAWFFASFDDFVKKAERYRKAGEAIANTLPAKK